MQEKDHHIVSIPSKTSDIRHVVGPDLDLELCQTLVVGDQVLMEVNGVRYIDGTRNPMVASETWEVVENEWEGSDSVNPDSRDSAGLSGQLILKHPRVENPIILDYSNDIITNKPAVFLTTNEKQKHSNLPPGDLYIILQMVAYKLPSNEVNKVFPTVTPAVMRKFEEALEDDRIKADMLETWVTYFSKVKGAGWEYRCMKRIAIRANVPLAVVKALMIGDYKTLLEVPDEMLTRIRLECHWLPMLVKQNQYICHDVNREYVK